MDYIFLLSGENLKLAKQEVISLIEAKNSKLISNLLLLKNSELNIKLSKRLALTKSIYQLLFESNKNDLIKNIENYDWNSVYTRNFCVRAINLSNNKKGIKNKKNIKDYSEKDLAGYIWDKLKTPKVNLKNPKTQIEFFFHNDKVYCCKLIKKIKDNYEKRKAHKRPFHHPSSLHPRIAKVLVNLTGANPGETIVDPFCGGGGFLIEAGLMGINTIGYDIIPKMIEGCKQNLEYFKIKNFKLKRKNALSLEKADYVVTDLPYGLNSTLLASDKKKISLKTIKKNKKESKESLEKFYLQFFKKLKSELGKRAVIVLPGFVNYKDLIKKSGLTVKNEFELYVHKSLTRKIVVLE